ncbi:MAG: TIGR02147 family protein [Bdellovibrionales bacterium]|nr:TIGR02147 family protein [Bdellovibrionales bacterium]
MDSSAAAKKISAHSARPEVYTHHDYRLFLRELLQYLKQHERVSTRQVAKASGVSESYLSMVVSGQRRLSEDRLRKLAPALGLERSEASYLEWLITVVEAASPEEQFEALKKIQRFRQYQNMNPLEIETYKYLEHWYHIAIRELAQLPGFVPDPKWIQDNLRYKVGLPEIKQALSFLFDHGFLRKDANGEFVKPEKLIQCKTGVLKPALTKFHTEMLHLAAQSISEIPSQERNISAYTGAIPSDKVEEARAILEEARRKIIELAQTEGADSNTVYHFGFLAFPLTTKLGE